MPHNWAKETESRAPAARPHADHDALFLGQCGGVVVHRRAASRQTEPPHSRRVTAETVFCDNCVYWIPIGSVDRRE